MRFPFHEIWIDEDAAGEPLAERVRRALPSARVLTGPDVRSRERSLVMEPDPFRRGKRILRLTRHRGAFVKPCPGTPNYVCCGLKILHVGQGCPMDCRYCALQVYFNRPVIEVFVNWDDLLHELSEVLDSHPDSFFRLCTGEFTDSLALDPMTGTASSLVAFFSERSNASLELKTKTDFIDPLLDLDPRGRVILSFSMNWERIAKREELQASSLDRRIAAAAAAQHRGYRIGFHFDPIIPAPGWKEGYGETVRKIFSAVDPGSIAWISLGVIRFVARLKETVLSRFGPVSYFHDGFIRARDGKSRLPAERRIEVYRFMAEIIGSYAPDALVYLCMESSYVWERSLGVPMESDGDLSRLLDTAVR